MYLKRLTSLVALTALAIAIIVTACSQAKVESTIETESIVQRAVETSTPTLQPTSTSTPQPTSTSTPEVEKDKAENPVSTPQEPQVSVNVSAAPAPIAEPPAPPVQPVQEQKPVVQER